MKQTLEFRINCETEFPMDLIDDAPTSGQFDEFAKYIIETYNVDVSLDDSIKYLKGFGAWDLEELQDLDNNKVKILWIALLDCKENDTNIWYMGE
jgi:hypothetical protein